MRKPKFYYNPTACQYEPVKITAGSIIFKLILFIGISVCTGVSIAIFYPFRNVDRQEESLTRENEELKFYYDMMQAEVGDLRQALNILQDRDDNVYRVIFEAEPLDKSVRQAGVGGTERYKKLLEKGLSAEGLIIETLEKVENLKKEISIQANSYKTLMQMAQQKNNMYASIPAIQPISNKHLHRLSSGFGRRIDPFYKTKKFHSGIDFSAPTGTPIYATGAGKVKKIEQTPGYGKYIVITHGYGYQTLYAHLSRFHVQENQQVDRGECIGYVGKTGKSTAPHLHYEVHYNQAKVNPVHFFFEDISQSEYEELLRRASIENQSLE